MKKLLASLFVASNLFAVDLPISWNRNLETFEAACNSTTANDFSGYKVYWKSTSDSAYQVKPVAGDVTSTTLSLLPGSWVIALTAVDACGNESTKSNEITRVVALPPPQSGSVLANAASNLEPGKWTTISTINIQQALTGTGGSSGHIFGYTDEIKWDSVTKRLFYLGMDHNQSSNKQRFVTYSDAANSWEILPTPAWVPNGINHGYDHMAVDPIGRTFSVRSPFTGITSYSYNIDSKAWVQLPSNGTFGGACCGGFEYFPEQGAAYWSNNWELYRLPNGAASWAKVGNFKTGNYHIFAEYSQVQQELIFGGGNSDPRKLWKVSSTGTVSALPNAPVDLGINVALHTSDPTSGEFLFFPFSTQGSFRSLNPITGEWKTFTGSPIINTFGTVATPIPDYGVTLFVECSQGQESQCKVRLYKHSGSGQPPVQQKDIQVSGVQVSAVGAIPGVAVSVSYTLTNLGSASITESFTQRVQLTPTNLCGGTFLDTFTETADLAPGQAKAYVRDVIVPGNSAPCSTMRMLIVADSLNSVNESDESNNSSSVAFEVK